MCMSDRAASRINVTANFGGTPYARSGGPFYPIDRWVNCWTDTVTVAGPAAPNFSLTVSVTETFSRVYYTFSAP